MISFAIALTRAWAAVYTRGLPPDVVAERREEIDCDLWHQQRLADLEREPVTGTAVEILVRWLFGIPADITWRLETGAAKRTKVRTSMNDSLPMKIGLGVALIGPLFLTLNGIGFLLLGSGDFESTWDQLRWGTAITLASLAIMGGLWLSAGMPRLGIPMVVTGIVVNCIVFYWMIPIMVPIGVAITLFAFLRAGLIRLPSSRPRAA